jgi:hypothetical protein
MASIHMREGSQESMESIGGRSRKDIVTQIIEQYRVKRRRPRSDMIQMPLLNQDIPIKEGP